MPADMVSLGRYLAEQVNEYDTSTFYNAPDEDLWGVGSTHVPSTGDLPRGLQSITYFRRETVGRAAVSIGAFDIPMVGSAKTKYAAMAVSVVASTEWSQEDLQAHQFAQSRGMMPGDNLIQSSIGDVSLSIFRRVHELVVVGFEEIGFPGLFNHDMVDSLDESATEVLQLTPSDLYDWFQGIVSNFKKSSKIPYERIIAYVSDDVMLALSRRFDDTTGDSPIQAMRSSERGVFVGDVVAISELDSDELVRLGVGVADEGLIILGDFRNPGSIIRRFATIDRTEPFMKDTGYHYGLTGWSSTTQPIIKIPEKFLYVKHGAAVAA
jgi:hypothetical protein